MDPEFHYRTIDSLKRSIFDSKPAKVHKYRTTEAFAASRLHLDVNNQVLPPIIRRRPQATTIRGRHPLL